MAKFINNIYYTMYEHPEFIALDFECKLVLVNIMQAPENCPPYTKMGMLKVNKLALSERISWPYEKTAGVIGRLVESGQIEIMLGGPCSNELEVDLKNKNWLLFTFERSAGNGTLQKN